ncbi:MAG: hypothetical protein ACFFAU_01425 [Candidatus Hodarchaeota archaeon]
MAKKTYLKIRKKWKINPKTRVKHNKKNNKKRQMLKLKKLNNFVKNSSAKEIIKYLKENEV